MPDDKYFLSFGQTKLSDETLDYLRERRSSDKPWNFSKELYDYCVDDVRILQGGCQRFLEENFIFQNKLIERFGRQSPKTKLSHLHSFTRPYCTLAGYR